jgi:RNA polymerase sigma factor (sigma-70 family)
MNQHQLLAERFEEHRPHLRAVAYRMLGSLTDADDAVQEAWLRVSRTDGGGVENLRGWLTTIVARVCLNTLKARNSRPEEPLGPHVPDPIVSPEDGVDPEHEALLADSVGLALLVVLDTLAPAERLAFVLHDMFAVPFDEIAPIIERSHAATRQVASRARRRVQGATPFPDTDRSSQREVVDAFLAASREGDFGALIAILDPDVVLRADRGALPPSRRSHLPELVEARQRRRSSTARRESSGLRTDAPSRLSDSRSGAAGSSRSTCWRTPRAFNGSISMCLTVDCVAQVVGAARRTGDAHPA